MDRSEPLIDLCTRLRGWGTPDPRTAAALAEENAPRSSDPDRPQSLAGVKAVRARAIAANWPHYTRVEDAKKAATKAVRELEGTDFTWNGDRHHDQFKVAAAEVRKPRQHLSYPRLPFQFDDGLPSIFDE